MEELNELEQENMEEESTEDSIEIVEPEVVDEFQTPVYEEDDEDDSDDNSAKNIAVIAIGSIGILAGLAIGTVKYLKSKRDEKKGNHFKKRLMLVTVDEEGNIVFSKDEDEEKE